MRTKRFYSTSAPTPERTFVLGEELAEWGLGDLLLKQVHLVEEEDHGRVHEPLVVDNVVKQRHALPHAALWG